MNNQISSPSSPEFPALNPIGGSSSAATMQKVWRFFRFLGAYWWLPVLTLVIGVTVALAYVHYKTPTFVSHASMWQPLKLKLPDSAVFTEDVQNFMGTQSELLQSDKMKEMAFARMLSMTNSASIPRGKNGQPLPVEIHVVEDFKGSMFIIEAHSSNPAYTRDYLNALMAAYLDFKRDARKLVSGDTLASITEQVERSERDLKTQQDAFMSFQQTNNLAVLQQDAEIAGSYLAKLKTELSDLQLEARLINSAEYDKGQGEGSKTNSTLFLADSLMSMGSTLFSGGLLERQSFNTDAGLIGSSADVEVLRAKRAKLSQYLKPKHPKIVKIDNELEKDEKFAEIYHRESLNQLKAARESNQMKMDNLQSSIKQWEAKVQDANGLMTQAEQLKLNVQRQQTVYDRLVALMQNVGISRNIDQDTVAILQPASEAQRTYKRELMVLAFCVICGFTTGLGIVFLIGRLDDRFISVAEVDSLVGDAVVGMVPEVERDDNSGLPLLQVNDPRHVYAESYRSLRSALLFNDSEGENPRVLLITSARPNEGKSTVAVNLARTLAMAGSRVLLVDADLRKGHLHHLLGLSNENGLSELLRKRCTLAEVLQGDPILNLWFISRGQNAGNPGDLFLRSDLDQIIMQWRKEVEYVIIDSSPVFAADDASCLATKVDGTLFVVRRNHSSAHATQEALSFLMQRQAKILGLIFNGAEAEANSYRYYKYSDYYPVLPEAESAEAAVVPDHEGEAMD